MLVIYTFVFSIVFQSSWQAGTKPTLGEFALTLFAGLAAFNLFSEVVNRAPTLILAVPNYVKKVVFPLEILPIVTVGSALVNSLIMAGLVLLGSILLFGHISGTIFLLPLAYLPLSLLSLGLSWFLASLGVYVRDIGQGIGVAVQMLFFLSPVFYPVTAVPEPFRGIMMVNPLTLVLTEFRQTLLWSEMIDWVSWGIWVGATLLFAILGLIWFMKTKKGFADVM
jgi:lipopolysaccharide transport system permease protein